MSLLLAAGAIASLRGRRPKRGLPGGSVSHPWLTRRPRTSLCATGNPRSVRRPSYVDVPASATKAGPRRMAEYADNTHRDSRFRGPRSQTTRTAKAAGLSGVCTERAEHRRSRRRGSGRALWNVRARVDARARLWERSGRPGGGAYPRQAGAPARSDASDTPKTGAIADRTRSATADVDPRFRGDDG